MEKVYLLLRNNIERGPFKYEQLLGQSLVPNDLIWIEGESMSWMTPTELEEFHKNNEHHLNVEPVPSVVPKASHIAHPTRNQLFGPRSSSFKAPIADRQNIPIDSPILLNEGEEIDIRIHKKGGKLVSLDQLAGAAFIALVLTTAWFGRHQFFAENQETVSVVTPAAFMSEQSFAAKKEVAQTAIIPTENIQDSMVIAIPENSPAKNTFVTAKKNSTASLNNNSIAKSSAEEVETSDIPEVKSEVPAVEAAPIIKEETKSEPAQSDSDNNNETSNVAVEDVKKKKSLGQAIKGIFKKKNKDIEQ